MLNSRSHNQELLLTDLSWCQTITCLRFTEDHCLPYSRKWHDSPYLKINSVFEGYTTVISKQVCSTRISTCDMKRWTSDVIFAKHLVCFCSIAYSRGDHVIFYIPDQSTCHHMLLKKCDNWERRTGYFCQRKRRVKTKFTYLDYAGNEKLPHWLLLSLACWLMLVRRLCVHSVGLKVDMTWEILTVVMTSYFENVRSCKRHTVLSMFCF